MQWSVDGQTPEFLAATRMASLPERNVAAILAELGLQPGMRVLDVGSGSGEYTFRLGSQVEGVQFTGLEFDDGFVKFANRRVEGEAGWPFEVPNPANSYRFVQGDATDLPFADASFDAVVSHTFLTALADWPTALAEMVRVCKPGGTVSSVTNLTDDFYGAGRVDLFTGLYAPDDLALINRVNSLEAKLRGEVDLVPGIAPHEVPLAFDRMGLADVHCMPLGQYFSLSDARILLDEKRRYLELLRLAKTRDAERLRAAAPTGQGLSDAEWEAYLELVERRYAQLADELEDNREWEWFGNASLLVVGERCTEMDDCDNDAPSEPR